MSTASIATEVSQEPETPGERPGFDEIHILWIAEGTSRDGDTVSMTAVGRSAVEDIVLGLMPGLPKVHLHDKVLSPSPGGEDHLGPFRAAARGELGPFVLVVEGSVPHQDIIEADGPNRWIDRLAPEAWAVVAVGTCATFDDGHTMTGNPTGSPTGSMALADRLGRDFTSRGALPVVNIPGCPVQPENVMETLTWLLHHAAGTAPPPPLDHMLRPQWLFGKTVHEGCDRAASPGHATFAKDHDSPKCQVKVGCGGPVVNCDVPKRGWTGGIGGCPHVGGICVGCTVPGLPDAFVPFMDEPTGGSPSSPLVKPYGAVIRRLRGITGLAAGQEPKRHHDKAEPTSGHAPHRRP
jgi:hydrogenase small subunit